MIIVYGDDFPLEIQVDPDVEYNKGVAHVREHRVRDGDPVEGGGATAKFVQQHQRVGGCLVERTQLLRAASAATCNRHTTVARRLSTSVDAAEDNTWSSKIASTSVASNMPRWYGSKTTEIKASGEHRLWHVPSKRAHS